MNPISILIVDDEPLNFDVLEALLDEDGYVLHYASGGEQALQNLAICNPDLIMLDVMMPGMDGIEVCRRIKQMPEWQMVPILMVTALTEKQDLALCLDAGANDFLSKPVNQVELRARVRSMLRIKRQHDMNQALTERQSATIDILNSSLSELRSNVVMSLPHELNTSLNGISGIIELLLTQRAFLSYADVDELLELAQQSSKRLEKLIHRFLVYLQLKVDTRHDKGAFFEESPSLRLDSQSLLGGCAKEQAMIAHRQDDLVCGLQVGDIAINGNDVKFIIDELLENAFKFSMAGTPVTLGSETVGNSLVVKVSDQGRGMTEAQMEKIGAFMQFERGHYEQQGIGMGLEIVQDLAAFHGWKFKLTSVFGQGTEASIELPLA